MSERSGEVRHAGIVRSSDVHPPLMVAWPWKKNVARTLPDSSPLFAGTLVPLPGSLSIAAPVAGCATDVAGPDAPVPRGRPSLVAARADRPAVARERLRPRRRRLCLSHLSHGTNSTVTSNGLLSYHGEYCRAVGGGACARSVGDSGLQTFAVSARVFRRREAATVVQFMAAIRHASGTERGDR